VTGVTNHSIFIENWCASLFPPTALFSTALFSIRTTGPLVYGPLLTIDNLEAIWQILRPINPPGWRYRRGVSDKPRFTLSEHDMLFVIVLSTCCASIHSCPLTIMSPSPGKSPINAPVSKASPIWPGSTAKAAGWLTEAVRSWGQPQA
jgi:hypothetical protein